MEFLQLEAPLMMSYLNAHQPRHIFYGLKQSEIRFSLYRWDAKSPILSYSKYFGPVVLALSPGVAGGATASPDFGRSVDPISTKGGRLCPANNTGTPGFSDLPTALR